MAEGFVRDLAHALAFRWRCQVLVVFSRSARPKSGPAEAEHIFCNRLLHGLQRI